MIKVVTENFEAKGNRLTLKGHIYSDESIEKIRVFPGKGKETGPDLEITSFLPSLTGIEKMEGIWDRSYKLQINGDTSLLQPVDTIDDFLLYIHVYCDGRPVHEILLTFNEMARTSNIRLSMGNREAKVGYSEARFQHNCVLTVRGWCFSDVRVDEARIYINNKYRGKVPVNIPRKDVYEKFADCKYNDCGFGFKKLLLPKKRINLVLKFYSGDMLVFISSQLIPLKKINVVIEYFEVKRNQLTFKGLIHSDEPIKKIRVFPGKGKNIGPDLKITKFLPLQPGILKKDGPRSYKLQIHGDTLHFQHIDTIYDLFLNIHVYRDNRPVQKKILTFKEITRSPNIQISPGNRNSKVGYSELQLIKKCVLIVRGWCYSELKLDKVKIFINGKFRGKVPINISRWDVYEKFEECEYNDCGFGFKKLLLPKKRIHLLLEFYSGDMLVFISGQVILLKKRRSPPSVGDNIIHSQADNHRQTKKESKKYDNLSPRLIDICKGIKTDSSRSVLIYCADITGHRHLYSSYFIRYFLNQKYVVYFCYAGRLDRLYPDGRVRYKKTVSPYLEVLNRIPGVHFIDCCEELNGVNNELNFIVNLKRQLEPGVSFFIDGDFLKFPLLRQLLPWQKRLQGYNFSIFCLSEFIYLPVGRFQALKEFWLFIYCHFSNPAIFFHRNNFVETFPLLNKFFFRCICRYNFLTTAFCPDAGLAEYFKHQRLLFLPEPITSHLDSELNKKESSFYTRIKSRYQDFLEKNKDKHVLLMFGDLEFRKGYDLLLQLAAHDPGCVCVRFGRTKRDYKPTWEAILCKEKLIIEDRLFEVDTYIESKELIDFIFSTVRFMILPYRNYYRTSGVLIDVLHRGLPVLTSDNGVMANIVKNYRVGRVFPDGNLIGLQRQFSEFKQNYKNYLKNIEKFNNIYSEKNIQETLAIMMDFKG